MRPVHLIAALALLVAPAVVANNDDWCADGAEWDDNASYENDDGSTMRCLDIAYAMASPLKENDDGSTSPFSAGDPAACANTMAGTYMVYADLVGCCVGQGGSPGWTICGSDPAGVCEDPDSFQPDEMTRFESDCSTFIAYMNMPGISGEGTPAFNEGIPLDDPAVCNTCAGYYMAAADVADTCCDHGMLAAGCTYDNTDMRTCPDDDDDSGSRSEPEMPSEECLDGCVEDCYGSDDFKQGGRWNKNQCVCLVRECYDSRDCDDEDVERIEDFVDGGCGAKGDDSSYDYSYDYRNVEDIAEGDRGDGAAARALSAVAVAVAMLW